MLAKKSFISISILFFLFFEPCFPFAYSRKSEKSRINKDPVSHNDDGSVNRSENKDIVKTEDNDDINNLVYNKHTVNTDNINEADDTTKTDCEDSKNNYVALNTKSNAFNIAYSYSLHLGHTNDREIPTYFDWRDHGAVSPVKDQGRCGACWAFSIVANIESMYKIHWDLDMNLSEKFLIDCVTQSSGCASGSLLKAYASIVTDLGGILQRADYDAYNGRQNECSWTKPGPPNVVPVTGFRRVRQNESDMAAALFHSGPLTAAINDASMGKYKGNYIDEPSEKDCSSDPKDLNHAVLIVGYNVYVDKTTGREVPYWIIKNSWGSNWGDKGFYYLVRGRNACGIANDVSFATVN